MKIRRLLGVAIRRKKMSVPVGKVQILRMFPITFKEFLLAADERTYQYMDGLDSLTQSDVMPYYWSSENRAEVDFVLQLPTEVIPVEVKSDTRISGKSLSVYTSKFNPSFRIRFSMNNLKENDGLLSCPIPLTDWIYRITGLMKAE